MFIEDIVWSGDFTAQQYANMDFMMRGCSEKPNLFEYVINMLLYITFNTFKRSRRSPQIYREIVQFMYKRDHIHKKAVKMGDSDLMNNYIIKINYVTRRIRQAKITQYKQILTDNKFNSLKVWK